MAVEFKLLKLVFMLYNPPRDPLWSLSVLEELTCLIDPDTSITFFKNIFIFIFWMWTTLFMHQKATLLCQQPIVRSSKEQTIKLGTTSKPCYTFINWRLSLIDKVSSELALMGLLFSSLWIIATFDTALDDWWEIL